MMTCSLRFIAFLLEHVNLKTARAFWLQNQLIKIEFFYNYSKIEI